MGSSERKEGRLARAILCVLGLAALGSHYRGCGNASVPEDGTPLPEATSRDCLTDAECGADECSIYACVAGTCMPAGPVRDADADGVAPPPCGEDCNDSDERIRPDAPELCDGVDQDCDGLIDDDASGTVYRRIDDALSDAKMVALGDRFVVVGRSASGTLDGYVVAPDGTPGTSMELVVVIVAEEPVEMFDVVSDGTRVHIAFARAGRGPEHASVVLEGAVLRVERVEPLGATSDVTSIAAHSALGDTWIAFDTIEAGGTQQRSLWRASTGDVVTLAASDAGPVIADDGTNLVVSDGDRTLSFRTPAGAETGRQVLPGMLGEGRPVGSDTGGVLVAYRDAFDHLLTTVTATTSRSPATAPSGDRTDQLSLTVVPDGVLFARWSTSSVRAWILAPDLRTIVSSFTAMDLSPMFIGPTRVSVATSTTAVTAILSSYGDASILTFLACTTAP